MKRVLCIGAALQDIYLLDHDDLVATKVGGMASLGKVVPGSKVDIDRMYFEVGGGGLNAAVTLARNGHEVIFMGNVAHDAAGDAVMRVLDRESIDNSYVGFVERGGTGASVILLDKLSGERTVLTYRGASAKYSNFDENDLDLIQPDWLYITTLRGDMETLERFLIKAHDIGAKVMLNPGIKELEEARRLMKLLAYVDVLLVNKEEASRLVPGTTLTELAYHLGGYVPVALITDGGMGGVVNEATAQEMYRFGIYEDVKVVDATGAGDAFGSGFLAAYAEGASLEGAVRFGSANATAVVQEIGANTRALYGDEVLHMMPMQKI
ncbi:carbohydrate kinase family protein [Candidatus Saccharibacteria bacterium]|nr:carbohydrate kinase family protein [Candidatus Saccharibacteria bacterium]